MTVALGKFFWGKSVLNSLYQRRAHMSKQRKSQVHTFPSLSKPWSALRTTRTLGDPWGTGPRFYSSGLKKTPSTQISCQTPSFLLEHIWPPPSPSSCGLNATEQDRSTTMVHINGVTKAITKKQDEKHMWTRRESDKAAGFCDSVDQVNFTWLVSP